MSDQLHQINVGYVAKEDRLLLRVSTKSGDEFRVWLTRRYTALLIDALQKQMEKFGGAPSLASSDETKDMFKQGAMDKSYEEEQTINYPLGESGILVSRIDLKTGPEGNLILGLTPDKGQGITLNLSKALLYMFYNLLTQGIDRADWRLLSRTEAAGRLH